MTPVLLILLFVLVVDLFVLLDWSHDSRDGRDWQPRGAPTRSGQDPRRAPAGLHREIRSSPLGRQLGSASLLTASLQAPGGSGAATTKRRSLWR